MKKTLIVIVLKKSRSCPESSQPSISLLITQGKSFFRQQALLIARKHSIKYFELPAKLLYVRMDGVNIHIYNNGDLFFYSNSNKYRELFVMYKKFMSLVSSACDLQVVRKD